MASHPCVLVLGEVLQQQIRAHKSTAKAVSLALGWHPAFLSRALRGHRPLRVEVVFEVLAQLRIVPFELFMLAFPFGGERLPSLSGGKNSVFNIPELRNLMAKVRKAYRRQGRRSPAEYRLRLGELVAREIRRVGFTVAEVSRRIGLGPTALGQALRGKAQLTFFHVLAALEAVEVHPGRVLLSVFLPDEENPVVRAARDEALAALDHKAPEGLGAFLRRRERKAAERAAAETEPQSPAEDEDLPPNEPRAE